MPTTLIPKAEKGKSVDLEEEFIALNETDARQLFQETAKRIARPGDWHTISQGLSAVFSVDQKDANKELQTGDHIRINIPGPGLAEGDGDDWVRVEAIERNFDSEADESYGILLRVSQNPDSANEAVAHFFAKGASSTFIVTRKKNKVTVFYKGRNETPNLTDLTLTDKLRNLLVAGGALVGFSEIQWAALLKGLLSPAES